MATHTDLYNILSRLGTCWERKMPEAYDREVATLTARKETAK